MNTEQKYEVPTWKQLYEMLLNIADKIRRDRYRPDVIVGICRGGWPPARVLSDLLGNPNLANVRAEFYLGVAETKAEPVITQLLSVDVRGKKVLIVDEVADTGKSLKLVQEHISQKAQNGVKTATVYYKPWSIVKPDYYEKETSLWIVFPWEIRETVGKIVKKCRTTGRNVEEEIERFSEAGVPAELVRRFLNELNEEEKC